MGRRTEKFETMRETATCWAKHEESQQEWGINMRIVGLGEAGVKWQDE